MCHYLITSFVLGALVSLGGSTVWSMMEPDGQESSARLPKIWSLHVQPTYFELIRTGKKKVEIRTADEEKKQIKTNDLIHFFHNKEDPTDHCVCHVTEIIETKTFREALETVGYTNALPHVTTLDEAVKIYDEIPGYREKETLGVLAFQIVRVEDPTF